MNRINCEVLQIYEKGSDIMDRVQMEIFYDTYKNTVYRTAFAYCRNRTDAEDITQEVFIKLFSGDYIFENPEHEKAWLIRVTVNKCKDLFKSFRFRFTVSLDDCDAVYTTPEESEVFHAVMELPKKYRIAVHLYYYEDYSVKQISEMTRYTETAVQTQLYRARKMLKDKLGKEFRYEFKCL